MMSFVKEYAEAFTAFPLAKSPLVQCITNEITCESMANALLYVDAKPVMADDVREFSEFFQQNDAVLLNLGHISLEREQALIAASRFAAETGTPTVVDLVGVAATRLRFDLGRKLEEDRPSVIKGNISEMRKFAQLNSDARGVDAAATDQEEAALLELAAALQKRAATSGVTYLATGVNDLIVTSDTTLLLANGVPQLDRFTGTGDIVGALIAALLGSGQQPLAACLAAVSYFNRCGEKAASARGLADFRQQTLNNLSLLMEEDWAEKVQGRKLICAKAN